MTHCKDRGRALLPELSKHVDIILLTWQLIWSQYSVTWITSLNYVTFWKLSSTTSVTFSQLFKSTNWVSEKWMRQDLRTVLQSQQTHYSVKEEPSSLIEQIQPGYLQIPGMLLLEEPHFSSMAPKASILPFLWSSHSFMLQAQLPPILIMLPGMIPLDSFHLPKSMLRSTFFIVCISHSIEEKTTCRLSNTWYWWCVMIISMLSGTSQLPSQPKRNNRLNSILLPFTASQHQLPWTSFKR